MKKTIIAFIILNTISSFSFAQNYLFDAVSYKNMLEEKDRVVNDADKLMDTLTTFYIPISDSFLNTTINNISKTTDTLIQRLKQDSATLRNNLGILYKANLTTSENEFKKIKEDATEREKAFNKTKDNQKDFFLPKKDSLFDDPKLAKDFRTLYLENDDGILADLEKIKTSFKDSITEAEILFSELKKANDINIENLNSIRQFLLIVQSQIKLFDEKYNALIKKRKEYEQKVSEQDKKKPIPDMDIIPSIITPVTSAKVIPMLKLIGSRYVKNEKGGSQHAIEVFVSSENTDTSKAFNLEHLTITDMSSFVFKYNYQRSFYPEDGGNAIGIYFEGNYLNKKFPIFTDLTRTALKNVSNAGFIHFKIGIEAIVVKKYISVYGNINLLRAVNNVKVYKNYFNITRNDMISFIEVGIKGNLHIGNKSIQINKDNDLIFHLGFIFINDDLKNLYDNDDIIIPFFKIGFQPKL